MAKRNMLPKLILPIWRSGYIINRGWKVISIEVWNIKIINK